MLRSVRARTAVAVLLAVFAVLLPASVARADPSDDAVVALRSSAVYVGAKTPTINRGALSDTTLSGVKVAILPTGGPDPVTVARTIGSRLDADGKGLTVLVFEDHGYGAASTAFCDVGTIVDEVVAAHRSQLESTDDVTATVRDFVTALRKAPSAAHGCSAGSTAPTTAGGSDPSGNNHIGLIVGVVIAAVVIAGVWYFVHRRRQRAMRELADARAQVMPYFEHLASDVKTINPQDNHIAQQAMADAAERLTSAGNQLNTADSVERYAQARRTVLEGLYATRTARAALGLDPGPPLPGLAGDDAGHLRSPQQVTVQGQTFQGYPAYSPAAPYYFGGGWGVPGGWYGVPFWETLLLGSVLAGGFGGFGWGGYDTGYDTGYQSGYSAGEQAATDDGSADGGGWGDSGGGGSWGDSGGWGSGDGGWGDSGGGGSDWGSSDGGSW